MFLYGASGHAKVIIDILKSSNKSINGLFDDNSNVKSLFNYPVYGSFDVNILGDDSLIISIGLNKIRKSIVEKLPNYIRYDKSIHTSAIISEYSTIGSGTVVMQGAIIQASVCVGKHCIINTGATIDHDSKIEDFVHIAPGVTLCGNVTVGEGTWIGAGAVVIPGIRIGCWAVIEAGSVVFSDIPDCLQVSGNP